MWGIHRNEMEQTATDRITPTYVGNTVNPSKPLDINGFLKDIHTLSILQQERRQQKNDPHQLINSQ